MKKRLVIGVPKERKTLEKRVALTPEGAKELCALGATVVIETEAGRGSFFPDDSYRDAGCEIVETLKEVWERAELLVKVKEPHAEEYQYFRNGLVVFDYLHLAGLPDVAKEMQKGGVTGIAYELIQDKNGRLPLLEPMSEVAGRLSVQIGAELLLSQNGGRGVLLGGSVGVPAADVLVIGGGVAGRAAVSVATGMGARVTVLDLSREVLGNLKSEFGSQTRALYSSPTTIAEESARADLVISAVLVPGAKAPKILSRDHVKNMLPGSVIIDISIDQGGSVETIRPTTLEEPTYVEHGVIHYGVQNMPAQTARTSTRALTSATLPFIREFVLNGLEATLEQNQYVKDAVCVKGGQITNEAVKQALTT